MVDLLERIEAMRRQESSSYKTEHYLDSEFQKNLSILSDDECPGISAASLSSSSSSSTSGINEVWREKICEWSYQVIDHFDFSREIVSVSIHILDRYLSKHAVNKKSFQLAAMTALCIAIKLHEPGRINMKSMIELSRGYFKVGQMQAMEMSILRSLGWQVHPPTAYCFAKHLLFLLPYSSVPMNIRHDILELTRFLTELSVIDYYFVTQSPSNVAAASLVYAMRTISGVPKHALIEFISALNNEAKIKTTCADFAACSERIMLLHKQGDCPAPEAGPEEPPRDETHSPVCVAHGLPAGTYPSHSFSGFDSYLRSSN